MSIMEQDEAIQKAYLNLKNTIEKEIIPSVKNTLDMASQSTQPHNVLHLRDELERYTAMYYEFDKMLVATIKAGDDLDAIGLVQDIQKIARKMETICKELCDLIK